MTFIYLMIAASLVFAASAVWIGAKLLRDIKNSQDPRRSEHDDTAYGCRYWWGDRAGVNLSAVCPVCGPPKP